MFKGFILGFVLMSIIDVFSKSDFFENYIEYQGFTYYLCMGPIGWIYFIIIDLKNTFKMFYILGHDSHSLVNLKKYKLLYKQLTKHFVIIRCGGYDTKFWKHILILAYIKG